MFPILAGAITLVLLVLYCWWIQDDEADDNEEPTERPREQRAKPQLPQQSQAAAIPVSNWPRSSGQP